MSKQSDTPKSVSYRLVPLDASLHAGFVDADVPHDVRLDPRLISNDKTRGTNLLSVLKHHLGLCDQFDFSVAFIHNGGLQTLIETFNALAARGVKGRFLTSTYLNFNSPDALEKLLDYPNIEVRVFQGDMHAKGYLFKREDLGTVIVGSSNLTQAALTCNKEWNVLFHSYEGGEMFKAAQAEFETLWESSQTARLTREWVSEYRAYLVRESQVKTTRKPAFRLRDDRETIGFEPAPNIVPNDMQRHALEALDTLHSLGERRALLVSATGTGKTYLSAFEIRAQKPSRVLFIAHRERILTASAKSFKRVLGHSYTYGMLGGSHHDKTATCLFAMVSTLVRHLDPFARDAFDYIIIDEAHRAGAESYQKILDYFTPKFCLGMTATPDRTDGYDIYGLFDHRIAYRITLQDALDNDMLAPFHYFGISDLDIDDQAVDDFSLFNRLTSDARVGHIIGKIEEYSIGSKRCGLVFCNRNEEARTLSEKFNERGYRTRALSGEDSDATRNRAIADLESGALQYLFTVDIFNEGIDIPCLNQIIMLRRTESPIVFVQQLGRGLRKAEGKEYTLVLDFIGNYQKNYLVPVALSGDRTYNKDNLRKYVKEGSTVIPGCSTVNFDRVSEARIFRAIDGGNFSEAKRIKSEYTNLKNILGRIPSLADFDENEAMDPLIIFGKYGSYHAFLSKCEPGYTVSFSSAQCDMLAFVSKKLANGKRASELALLKRLIERADEVGRGAEAQDARAVVAPRPGEREFQREAALRTRGSATAVLSGSFASGTPVLVQKEDNGSLVLSDSFKSALTNPAFRQQMLDVIEFGLARHQKNYAQPYGDTDFVLYAKYTYEEVCRLLNWDANVNGQNLGGYKYDEKTNTFPVFINYDKAPDISDTIRYEDRFVSERDLIAISKQPRHMDSPEIQRLKAWPENGMRTFLFVRKNKDDQGSKEFYFLGTMHPTQEYREFTMPNTNKTAVEIRYVLDTPVRDDLYEYLTSSFEDAD